jgi:DNA-directed RNA polymerase subunit RPC12/RpoP
MSIQTTCAKCGAEFTASREEILAGPSWRLCPACRKEQR